MPLVAHIIHRLDFGGLENGLVNIINRMPAEKFRHAIICLTDYSEFSKRIKKEDVKIYALHKRTGKDLKIYSRLWKLLREIRPTIVHTRNLAALDSLFPAWLAGVPCRVHSEHGWDMFDLHGENKKYALLRKLSRPLIHRYLAMSKHQMKWLSSSVNVSADVLRHIYNGVDIKRFFPKTTSTERPVGLPFGNDHFLIGTVGRMQQVKDQLTLARAFVELIKQHPDAAGILRLVMIGDGPLREQCLSILKEAGVEHLAWLPGARNDIPELLRSFNLFVLPSLNEGISNTILEAMASGLPVIATNAGGNPELVQPEVNGLLVPVQDSSAMAAAIAEYFYNRNKLEQQGLAARIRIVQTFSLDAMVQGYVDLYHDALAASA